MFQLGLCDRESPFLPVSKDDVLQANGLGSSWLGGFAYSQDRMAKKNAAMIKSTTWLNALARIWAQSPRRCRYQRNFGVIAFWRLGGSLVLV
jgi:hypothetical protein